MLSELFNTLGIDWIVKSVNKLWRGFYWLNFKWLVCQLHWNHKKKYFSY